MDFKDIPGRDQSFSMRLIGSRPAIGVDGVDVLEVAQDPSIDGDYTIRLRDTMIRAQCNAPGEAKRLKKETLVGDPYLARITEWKGKDCFELSFKLFSGRVEELEDVEIGVDDRIIAQVRKKAGESNSPFGVCNDLRNDFRYDRNDGTAWFFMIAGPAAEDEFRSRETPSWEESDDDRRRPPATFPTLDTAFLLFSGQSSFVASKTEVDGRAIYLMSRYHQRKNRDAVDHAVRLVRGNLKFTDWTKTGEVSKIVEARLAEVPKQNSYLRKWDEFGNFEGKMLLRTARKLKSLHYTKCRLCKGETIELSLDSSPAGEWRGVSEVELVAKEPEYLQDEEMTFEKYVDSKSSSDDDSKRAKRDEVFSVVEFNDDKKLILKGTELPAFKEGYVVMPLLGDIVQVKRRRAARSRISGGRSANPSLGLLIEAGAIPQLRERKNKVRRALTSSVRSKVFPKNPPTARQEEAIRIALNTPDIALIQGPPGTGKTTVITAILERLNEEAVEPERKGEKNADLEQLNEEADKAKRKGEKNADAGQVLLTGFQHDAVENMIGRMSVNSLPIPKFGRRSNSDGEDDSYRHELEEWCHALAEKIRARHPQLRKTEEEMRLDELCLQYLLRPSTGLGNQIVEIVSAENSPVPNGLRDRARKMLGAVKRRTIEDRRRDEVVRCIRNLRVTEIGFADDGPDRALDLKMALDDLDGDSPRGMEILEAASEMPCGVSPSVEELERLRELKALLMKIFAPPPRFTREKRNEPVEHLATDVRKAIQEFRGKGNNGFLYVVMAKFLATMELRPERALESLAHYSFAYAATCQQSMGKNMVALKTGKSALKDTDGDMVEYDYVIVDEAARASPRDLMIALAQGRKIVLVGDHRQLPHIIDEEVAKQMEAGDAASADDELEWLKKSMFEYLFSERIPELEKNDGISRRVTLDMQYRMHPVLGDFISRNFYERFDVSERFQSGLDAELFSHSLEGTDGVPAIWLDVPTSMGGFCRLRSGSLVRDCEAKAIRKAYSKWSTSEAGRNLSYGVISFYKGQAAAIRKEIGGADNTAKLRIGTVDGFQGMEFDVVFLSLVRTHRDDLVQMNEKAAARAYGFLSLYNRLNVSMSRQKRLLVLVGDVELTRTPFAEKYISGIVNFRKLCETHGKVIHVV